MTTPKRRNISENVRLLHDSLINILNDEDRAYFIHSLNKYQKDRDVIELVASLKSVLDSPRKQKVYPLLREIIPLSDKRYFEKTWHAGSRPQSLHSSSKEWTLTRPRSQSRPVEPLSRSNIYSSLPENLDKYDSGIDISNLKNGSNLRSSSHKYPIRRLYIKRAQGTGFGFSMRGGSEHGVGLYVSAVDENSLAEYEGLLPGDHILSVNEINFDGLTHDQAVKIIKSNKKLNMVVRSVGCIPNTFVAEATYKWIDPLGKRVTPPSHMDSNGREMSLDGIHRSDLRLLGDDDERKVNIYVDDGDKLGLRIRGGAEYGLGIYIAGVDLNSAAEKAGLKCGDQIMDVNGHSFLNINHEDAVKVLKSARNMMVTMKDVGRLPFAKSTTDKTRWTKGKLPSNTSLQSDTDSIYTTAQVHATPDNRRNTTAGITRSERRPEDSKFLQGFVGSQLMYNGTGPSPKSLTEDQARHILNDNEFGTLVYYLEEYKKGYITVDSFVLALFSLLNTPAKVSLLTEIRGSIHPKDIDHFDDLVLKKEIDAIKTRNMAVNDDARSTHSYSSSLSSYSARSSSSRSSAKNSFGDVDSRPITPPRVPDVYTSVESNKDTTVNSTSHDKTITNDSENTLFSLPSSNGSFNNSQDSALGELLPICSSSPRKMTNGEITEYHLTGDNKRREADVTQIRQQKPTKAQCPSTSSEANSESTPFKILSCECPEEAAAKNEKRGLSLFGHSKFKRSYSPQKRQEDHSTSRREVLPLKKSTDKDIDKTSSLKPNQQSTNMDSVSNVQVHHDRHIDLSNNLDQTKIEKKALEKKTTNKDFKKDFRAIDIVNGSESESKPISQKMPTSGDNGDIKSSRSAFAPPKPPRTFQLPDEEPRMGDIVVVNTFKGDQSPPTINTITPPSKPKPYSAYIKDETTKPNTDNLTPIQGNANNHTNDYATIDTITIPSKPKPYSGHIKDQTTKPNTDNLTPIQGNANNHTDDYGDKSLEKSIAKLPSSPTQGYDISNGIQKASVPPKVMSKTSSPKTQCEPSTGKSSTSIDKNPIRESREVTQKNTQDISLDISQSFKKNNNLERQNGPPVTSSLLPYSSNQHQKDGMFLAMEVADASSRSGLERSTCWGDETTPPESPSLHSLVHELPKATLTEKAVSCRPLSNHVTPSEQIFSEDFSEDFTRKQSSGSLVRNMVNAYNHMNSEEQAKDTKTSQKNSSRKSWDGAQHSPGNDNNRQVSSSLESKRTMKSNSDSNLMNLPKEQQRDIQVKIRASQELLDLRQQAARSRESSTNNSPRQSIDTNYHVPCEQDHKYSDGYVVQIITNDKGLGLALEGGSDVPGADNKIKIKSVKEGPYAACLSGKLRPGQEIYQINKTPVKGMTNAMAVLTLRQAYADVETETLTLVIKEH